MKPDLAVVEWPDGEWEGNALVFDQSALQRRRMIGAPMMLSLIHLLHVPGSALEADSVQVRLHFLHRIAAFQGGDLLRHHRIRCLLYTSAQAPNGSWLSDHSAAYSTSAALLSLALNYRFLPIYEQ